ncbi:hypothetical protein [Chitinimonas naiadis]
MNVPLFDKRGIPMEKLHIGVAQLRAKMRAEYCARAFKLVNEGKSVWQNRECRLQ